MIRVDDIIRVLDEEIIRLNKSFLTLAQANKILFTKKLFTEDDLRLKTLKHLLEENQIPGAHQTIHEPKQWRIIRSNFEGDSEMESINKRSDEGSNVLISKNIYCPICGQILFIPNDILKEELLQCPHCSSTFANPLVNTSADKTLEIEPKEKIESTEFKYFVIVGLLIIAGVFGIKYFTNQNEERIQYSSPSYNSTTSNSTKEESDAEYRYRQSFKTNVLEDRNRPSAKGDNQNSRSSNQNDGNVLIFRSENYDIEKPNVEGFQTVNEVTLHKLDLGKMIVTEKCLLNGKYVTFIYPIMSKTKEIKGGYVTVLLTINTLGVRTIWYSPTGNNLGYDYDDGTRIACYDLTKIK